MHLTSGEGERGFRCPTLSVENKDKAAVNESDIIEESLHF